MAPGLEELKEYTRTSEKSRGKFPEISRLTTGFADRIKGLFKKSEKKKPAPEKSRTVAPERDLSGVKTLKDLAPEERRDWDTVSEIFTRHGSQTITRLDATVIPVGMSAFMNADSQDEVVAVAKELASLGYVCIADNDNLIPDDVEGKAYSLAKNGDYYQFRIGIIPDEQLQEKFQQYEGTQSYGNNIFLRTQLQQAMADKTEEDPSYFVMNSVPVSGKISISIAHDGLENLKNVLNFLGIVEYVGQEEVNPRQNLCFQQINKGENYDYLEIMNVAKMGETSPQMRKAA